MFNSHWEGGSWAGVGVLIRGGGVILLLNYKAESGVIANALYVCEGRGEERVLQEHWVM